MEQVVDAYRSVSVSDEFKEIERLRELARHNEASAIDYAVRKMAKNFKANDVDINTIAKSTGFTVEEIREL